MFKSWVLTQSEFSFTLVWDQCSEAAWMLSVTWIQRCLVLYYQSASSIPTINWSWSLFSCFSMWDPQCSTVSIEPGSLLQQSGRITKKILNLCIGVWLHMGFKQEINIIVSLIQHSDPFHSVFQWLSGYWRQQGKMKKEDSCATQKYTVHLAH